MIFFLCDNLDHLAAREINLVVVVRKVRAENQYLVAGIQQRKENRKICVGACDMPMQLEVVISTSAGETS